MSENDNASPPPESTLAQPTGEIPANGAKHHVDPRLTPKQQQRQSRVDAAVDKRVRGQGGGTYNELVNEVLDAEVNPTIERMGLHPRDVRVDVYREEPPGPRGQPLGLGGFSLDVAPTGHQIQETIEDAFHCVRQDMGMGTYRVTFRTYNQGKWLGDGRLHLDSCQDIMARRELARRRQAAQGGGSSMPGIGYVAPPPPPQQYPQQPMYPAPMQPPMQQQPPFQVHAPASPQQPDAVAQLRDSLGVVIELANRLGFTQPQAPVAAPPPMTEQKMAEVVAAAVVAGLKAAGVGGQAPAPAQQQQGPMNWGEVATVMVEGITGLRRAVSKIDTALGVGAPPPGAENLAEPVGPEEDDELPFRVIPVPGVKTKDGVQMNFAEDKKTGKAHLWGLAVSNPDLVGAAVNKAVEIAEKVVDANTINTKPE